MISKLSGTNCGERNQILDNILQVVYPIGVTYVQYPFSVGPNELWPLMKWVDMSSSYQGNFLRVLGGQSAAWETPQSSCIPKISHVENKNVGEGGYVHLMELPASGWSNVVFSGRDSGKPWATRFKVQDCEVRPANIAVRIWKRIH